MPGTRRFPATAMAWPIICSAALKLSISRDTRRSCRRRNRKNCASSVGDDASRIALGSDHPAPRCRTVAIDQQEVHLDLECAQHHGVLTGEAVEDFGLAPPLAAEVQQFDRPVGQPVHIIVEERLDQPRIARFASADEILDVLIGQNVSHDSRTIPAGNQQSVKQAALGGVPATDPGCSRGGRSKIRRQTLLFPIAITGWLGTAGTADLLGPVRRPCASLSARRWAASASARSAAGDSGLRGAAVLRLDRRTRPCAR